MAKKASKGVGLLRSSKHLVNVTTLKTIYDALVIPNFYYCALVLDILLKIVTTWPTTTGNKFTWPIPE